MSAYGASNMKLKDAKQQDGSNTERHADVASSFLMPWLRQRDPDILTPGETSAILEHLTPQNQILVLLAATTGLHISELRGLQWKDVDRAFAGSLPEPK